MPTKKQTTPEKGNGKPRASRREPASDAKVSYDDFKDFEGRRYTGMKVGRSHKWNYDPGVWKETKVTPDLWQISYAVTKRRAGKAPEGSGVPVGTEYHWYIAAHQNVKKLDANAYTTSLAGLKFKIAHKRADAEKWSATEKTQRKRLIRFLQGVIEELEQQVEEPPSEQRELAIAAEAKPKRKRTSKKAIEGGETAGREPAPPPSMKKPIRRRKKATA
jgi:hypothetical protein